VRSGWAECTRTVLADTPSSGRRLRHVAPANFLRKPCQALLPTTSEEVCAGQGRRRNSIHILSLLEHRRNGGQPRGTNGISCKRDCLKDATTRTTYFCSGDARFKCRAETAAGCLRSSEPQHGPPLFWPTPLAESVPLALKARPRKSRAAVRATTVSHIPARARLLSAKLFGRTPPRARAKMRATDEEFRTRRGRGVWYPHQRRLPPPRQIKQPHCTQKQEQAGANGISLSSALAPLLPPTAWLEPAGIAPREHPVPPSSRHERARSRNLSRRAPRLYYSTQCEARACRRAQATRPNMHLTNASAIRAILLSLAAAGRSLVPARGAAHFDASRRCAAGAPSLSQARKPSGKTALARAPALHVSAQSLSSASAGADALRKSSRPRDHSVSHQAAQQLASLSLSVRFYHSTPYWRQCAIRPARAPSR